jgi:hypothetical protein
MHPIDDNALQGYQKFVLCFGYGEGSGKKRDDIWAEYQANNGTKTRDNFERKVRSLCDTARKNGWRVINGDFGICVAETDKEWMDYCGRETKGIVTVLSQLAGGSKLSINSFVRKLFRKDKNDPEGSAGPVQQTLF